MRRWISALVAASTAVLLAAGGLVMTRRAHRARFAPGLSPATAGART